MRARYKSFGAALLLSLSLLAVGSGAQAQTVPTPPGWKAQNQSGATMLTPTNLPAGKAVTMLVFPPQPLNGQPLQAWADKIFKQGATQYGKALQPGQTVFNDPTWSYAQLVEVNGKPFTLNFFAFPAGAGKAQLVSLLMNSEKALSDQYTPKVAEVLVSLIQSGNPPAVASKPTAPATGSDGKGVSVGGGTLGGPLTFGTFNCTKPLPALKSSVSFTLDLYKNGEWRQNTHGNEIDTGRYKYDPKTGTIDIYGKFKMYNYKDEDISIFFKDAKGNPVIYAEEDSLSVYKTTCLYAGATKLPDPTTDKTQKEAAEAEARRFKWVTAPGKGVQLNQIQALIYDGPGQHRDVSSSGKTPELVLLLKDGWAYTGLRVTPHDLDAQKSRQNEPENWFKWRQQGGKYQLFDRMKNAWQVIAGTPVLALKNGEKLSRSFTHNSFSNTSSGTSYSESTISFKADGKFEELGVSKSATSVSQSLYLGSGSSTSSTYSKNGCFASSQSSAGYTPSSLATVNSGASQRQDCGSDNAGKYTVDGYTLELRYDSGRVTRKVLYFRDSSKENIGIDYNIYGPAK